MFLSRHVLVRGVLGATTVPSGMVTSITKEAQSAYPAALPVAVNNIEATVTRTIARKRNFRSIILLFLLAHNDFTN